MFCVVRPANLLSAGKSILLALSFTAALLGYDSGASAASSPFMPTGSVTSQPIGHYEFCKRRPDECSIHPSDLRPLAINKKLWDEIVAVNTSVNEWVKPVSDLDHYGVVQYWNYPDDGMGNCEHYALEKRRELMEKGISLADLLITVVRLPDGEGHAVVTVRTDRGDFILDNLTDQVKNWTQTPYHYLKRQATDDTGLWVDIIQKPTVVAAVAN
ncbi:MULTISPECIES: transglutaminase-like cysteine peptidase [unclassified Rhizobium]|jgi:predicted transglutaminase-like cysteine proteinase|uniref:transglutaminase-like cysteine peptidase n=1 Tax=unclassified Rhizobium TaxID=2613769 RepID=UPI0009DDC79C|nr:MULTISPECIES: transglutaminase-like cysteine peptidase [unclassified Rhizobium]MBN8952519.1 transglutaminase-like cysteine peptidase [Rhizobium tropici]RKD67721.1 putative transglutaminase-like cysteine proteinase [Rhizobium sp. WW_1]